MTGDWSKISYTTVSYQSVTAIWHRIIGPVKVSWGHLISCTHTRIYSLSLSLLVEETETGRHDDLAGLIGSSLVRGGDEPERTRAEVSDGTCTSTSDVGSFEALEVDKPFLSGVLLVVERLLGLVHQPIIEWAEDAEPITKDSEAVEVGGIGEGECITGSSTSEGDVLKYIRIGWSSTVRLAVVYERIADVGGVGSCWSLGDGDTHAKRDTLHVDASAHTVDSVDTFNASVEKSSSSSS